MNVSQADLSLKAPIKGVIDVFDRKLRPPLPLVCLLLFFTLNACSVDSSPPELTTQAVSLESVTRFGSNPGNLRMFRFVPDNLPDNAPLVVALHGCTQSASVYANGAGWPKYAASDGFALVFPEQKSANNQNACFNWFEPGDIRRGAGEALSVKQMVDKMISDYGLDPERVFVTGLSAGGYMTTVMLATYPDVFAGGGVIAGGPYKCATSLVGAFSCLNPGVDKTPNAWGNLVRGAPSYSGAWPKVSIWHGDADFTVNYANLREAVEQWTNVHGTDQQADISDTVKGYPHKVYQKDGVNVVETYTLTGMGHGTPVDPGSAETNCGQAGVYLLDVNICSSYFTGRFWGIIGEADEGEGDGGGNGDNGGDNGGGDDNEPVTCWTDTNANHYAADRAVRLGVVPYESYSARGSYRWLGYGGRTVSLEEVRAGYFVRVVACP